VCFIILLKIRTGFFQRYRLGLRWWADDRLV
jgi:hypothetical protein